MFYELVDHDDCPRMDRIYASISPTIALKQLLNSLQRFETSGIQIDFTTWGLEYKNYSVRDGMLALIFDSVVLLVIGFYLEAVMPKTYGPRRHPLFFLLPSYWRGSCGNKHRNTIVNRSDTSVVYSPR